MASIPHTTDTSHDKQLEKLRGQDWFPGARSCPEVNNPRAVPVSFGCARCRRCGGRGRAPRELFPQVELLGPPWRPGVTEPRGHRRGRTPLPRVAPDVPPPPLAGAPWNSMTPGGAGRGARLSRPRRCPLPRPARASLRELGGRASSRVLLEGCGAAPALPLAALAGYNRVRNTTGYCLPTARSGTLGKPREGRTIPVLSGFAPSFHPFPVLFQGCKNR